MEEYPLTKNMYFFYNSYFVILLFYMHQLYFIVKSLVGMIYLL